jgi:alpha-glucuronidase
VGQYFPPVAEVFGRLDKVPEKHLLWFHHVSWARRMASGLSLWDELVRHYYAGVEDVRRMQAAWKSLEGRVDAERFEQVRAFLAIQENEARWWRDACVLYLQTFSGKAIPDGYERPAHDLAYYVAITKRHVPGN